MERAKSSPHITLSTIRINTAYNNTAYKFLIEKHSLYYRRSFELIRTENHKSLFEGNNLYYF